MTRRVKLKWPYTRSRHAERRLPFFVIGYTFLCCISLAGCNEGAKPFKSKVTNHVQEKMPHAATYFAGRLAETEAAEEFCGARGDTTDLLGRIAKLGIIINSQDIDDSKHAIRERIDDDRREFCVSYYEPEIRKMIEDERAADDFAKEQAGRDDDLDRRSQSR